MSVRKINILAAGPSPVADAIARGADPEKVAVKHCDTSAEMMRELTGCRYQALLISDTMSPGGAGMIVGEVRSVPLGEKLPVYMAGGSEAGALGAGADGAFAFDAAMPTAAQVADCLTKITGRVDEAFHPVTRLATGAMMAHLLQRSLHDVKKNGVVLLVKLFGLKAYNLHKNYDEGDRLMASFADMLCDVVNAAGSPDDFVGHLGTDKFCIFTREKKVETLCKSIMVKSERLLRSFYTPYELMRGYVTLDDTKNHGHFYLAEAMIGGVEIPVNWDSHYVYIVDLLKDLLKKVEADDSGYRIMKL